MLNDEALQGKVESGEESLGKVASERTLKHSLLSPSTLSQYLNVPANLI